MVATIIGEVRESAEHIWRGIDYNANIDPTVRIEPFCIIEEGVDIGENTLIGAFNHIRKGTKIGKNCKIGGHSTFEGDCSVGDTVRMGTHCNIGWGCHVDDLAFIAGQFTGGNDKRMIWQRAEIFSPEGWRIFRGARIGLGVVLLPGVTIGQEAMIGAGSLVAKSVPAFEMWYGHPAVRRGIVPQAERLKDSQKNAEVITK